MRGLQNGTGGERRVKPVQGARATSSHHGARQPIRPRSSSRAKPWTKTGRVRYWKTGRVDENGTGGRKRDGWTKTGRDIVKLGGPADVRAIFTRARHFDFGPPFAGDPWDDRPTLGACPRIRVRNPQVLVIKQLASFEPN